MALLSKNRMSKMMLDILLQFPTGTKNHKENITLRLGLLGQMSATRDINASCPTTNIRKKVIQKMRKWIDDAISIILS